MNETCQRARTYMYRCARPLEMALFQYHFEHGGREAVVNALSCYQNADGGFGHALEADAWNPYSSPIQTWAATEILREIAWTDEAHPMVRGILRYLESGADFDGHFWARKVRTNNDYPRAPWWTCEDGIAPDGDYNPTVCLAGFLIRFAQKGSALYSRGCRIAKEAIDQLLGARQADDMHTIANYISLYAYLTDAGETEIVDLSALKERIAQSASALLTRDTAQWATGYVCRPSQFVLDATGPFYPAVRELAAFERDFIRDTQLPDGSWRISWRWGAYDEEWALSKCWWKGHLIVKNLRFLRGVCGTIFE